MLGFIYSSLSMLTLFSIFNLFILFNLPTLEAHGRLTIPQPRLKIVDGGLNAPIYTCFGPAFQTSETSMRCHDAKKSSFLTTYNAGNTINLEWVMEAPHPGDCSIWLSYDTNVDSPQNWIKLKDIPGCLSPNGIDTPSGKNTYSFVLSENLPSCEHCVLRWEWYSVQQVSNVEFYVNCADIKIVNNKLNCALPSPTTQINGIEHLMYNLADPNQKGCPFYNVYDENIRPTLDKRSRGPKEWVPKCNTNVATTVPLTQRPTTQSITQSTISNLPTPTYPCTNINCGNFGTCNNGNCICRSGYTGLKCEIPPKVQCNSNCGVLNREVCQINNICGSCKTGFLSNSNQDNSLCQISCKLNCQKLNRRGCTEPNICGVCLPGFMEPNLKNKKESCIRTMGNPENGISLGVTAQWDTGFCANWVTTCPANREITFNIPIQLRDIRGWNLLNMQKINNRIIGNCAEWVATGERAYGGFCSTFNSGNVIKAGLKEFYFVNRPQRLLNNLQNNLQNNVENKLGNKLDNLYTNVSITLNLNDTEYLNYESFMDTLSLYLYGVEMEILSVRNNTNTTEISLKILCHSRTDFDSALFLHLKKINSCAVVENLFFKEPIVNENTEENEENTENSTSLLKINNILLLFIAILSFFK